MEEMGERHEYCYEVVKKGELHRWESGKSLKVGACVALNWERKFVLSS
jgi:hypothetical protein